MTIGWELANRFGEDDDYDYDPEYLDDYGPQGEDQDETDE